jgi:dipeptidyl aminopeptidase/acylaminoacyl peptidase
VSLIGLLVFRVIAQQPALADRPKPVDAAQAVIPLTPHDVAKIRVVVAAEISPDGKHVAVLTSVPRTPSEPNGRAHSELSVVPFEGGTPKVLVAPPGNLTSPQWAGDSSAVLFLSRRGDEKETRVWSVPVGGGDPTAVTPAGRAIKAYTTTADGKRLAFTEDAPEDATRAKRKKAGFVHEVFEEEWRFVRVRELDRASGQVRDFEVPGSVFEIEYNQSGEKLCVTAAPTPSVDDSYMRKKVYAVDCASGEVALAIDNKGKLGNATISPDGKMVAAVIGVDQHDPHESVLAVADLSDAGKYKVLTPLDYQGHVAHVAWGDAPGWMLTLCQEGVESLIVGGDQKLGISGGGAITRFSSSAKHRMALVASRFNHPQEAYVVDETAASMRRLTTSNPWLGEGSLGKQEVITWKARDGKQIQGILIHPLVKPKGPAPLVVCVHGGPEAHDMNGWLTGYSQPGQVGAGKGWYVLYPNYRSSTGRGVAFSQLGQGDLAGGEFTDILDGVDHLIALGLVDKAKVGITGGSYGGYLSAWAATKWTDRFAASVVFVGVSDQVSKRLCTDIPMEDYLVHWRIWTDENHALVWDRSPIAHAVGSKTPTLICHGKDDPRVHPSQSLELYRMLKNRGAAPVRLVWYPGEGHGNQLRASRLDYSLRMLAWFEHYLVKGGKEPPPAELEYGEGAAVPATSGK